MCSRILLHLEDYENTSCASVKSVTTPDQDCHPNAYKLLNLLMNLLNLYEEGEKDHYFETILKVQANLKPILKFTLEY